MPPLQPERNENGDVIPHDHAGILQEHGIIRRISEQLIVYDDKSGGRRIASSLAFKASSGSYGGMSVDLQHQIEEAGLDAVRYVTTPRWIGSVHFQAGQLRLIGLMIGPDPIEEKEGIVPNPYHGQVWGGFTRQQQKSLREQCEWFVPIDGVTLR